MKEQYCERVFKEESALTLLFCLDAVIDWFVKSEKAALKKP